MTSRYHWFSPPSTDDGFGLDRMGADGEEEEEDEDVDLSEVQRRRERLEKDQWLREQVCFFIFIFFSFLPSLFNAYCSPRPQRSHVDIACG